MSHVYRTHFLVSALRPSVTYEVTGHVKGEIPEEQVHHSKVANLIMKQYSYIWKTFLFRKQGTLVFKIAA